MTIDVSDLDRGSGFWCGLLGLDETHRRDQYAYLAELAPGVQLILQQVGDVKVSKNRIHVEVHSEKAAATVSWVSGHGGRLVEEDTTDWYSLVVMTDPDGNEFCVNRRPQAAPVG